MVLFVAAFLASLVPTVGLFLWLRSYQDDEFKGICNRYLIQGFLSVLPVVACSAILALTEVGLSFLGHSGNSDTQVAWRRLRNRVRG